MHSAQSTDYLNLRSWIYLHAFIYAHTQRIKRRQINIYNDKWRVIYLPWYVCLRTAQNQPRHVLGFYLTGIKSHQFGNKSNGAAIKGVTLIPLNLVRYLHTRLYSVGREARNQKLHRRCLVHIQALCVCVLLMACSTA